MHRNRYWVLASLGLVVLLSLIHQIAFRTLAEDAFISFRYSLNLASGNGPVFNLGERVEGYSNFLWVVLLAALHRVIGLDIPLSARMLGVVASLLTIILTYRLGLELTGGDKHSGLVAALLVAASGSFAAWGPSGMETPLFTLLIVAIVLCTSRESWIWAGLLIGLAAMTRPEGLLLLLPVGGALLTARSAPKWMRHVLAVVVTFSFVFLPWTIWRLAYYRHLVPNALRAKMGMDAFPQILHGLRYVCDFVQASAPLVALLGIVVVLADRPRSIFSSAPPTNRIWAAFAAVFVLFVVLVGGDWMPAYRFLAPIVPLGAAMLAGVWHANVREQKNEIRSFGGIVMAALFAWLLFSQSYFYSNMIPRVRQWHSSVDALSDIGRWLRASLPTNTPIATFANGALSYYSELPTIDMLGLTDAHIARSGFRIRKGTPGHAAQDYRYVAERTPSIVAFLGGQGFERLPSFSYDRDEFRSKYVPVSFRFPHSARDLGQYVNLLLLQSERDSLVSLLTAKSDVEVVSQAP